MRRNNMMIEFIWIAAICALSCFNFGRAFEVYFPMSTLSFNLPINEKSQSIFSKIPLAQIQLLNVDNNTISRNYIYGLENNEVLRINSTTGEIFVKDDYNKLKLKREILLTALSKIDRGNPSIPHMSFEINPQTQEEYCRNLENICFWNKVHYAIVENAMRGELRIFEPIRIGTLNSRGAKYLCNAMDVKYSLEEGSEYFALKNNVIYTKVPLDHETMNVTEINNLKFRVACSVKVKKEDIQRFRRQFNVTLIDRNDNGPQLEHNKVYEFHLKEPHFKANEPIGNKILFTDKDSLAANAHQIFQVTNDTNNVVRPQCNSYESDHTGKRTTIISCQLIFARNGILSVEPYCFDLEVSDKVVITGRPIVKTAVAHVCLYSNLDKIHESDRPLALALRDRKNRKLTFVASSSADSDSDSESDDAIQGAHHTMTTSVLSTYPRDAYVYRNATQFYRVVQPENFQYLMSLGKLNFKIAEDRSEAFGVTPVAGIVYVNDVEALKRARETVYFLNVTWHDSHQRSFVIHIHLMYGRPENASCEHQDTLRISTCAEVRFQRQCGKVCGVGTNGGGCVWRGSNIGFFSRNYASCVPDPKYCPDNVCDPLEELSQFTCPQDCTPANKIVGPHSVNDNKLGILSASGTCLCTPDTGRCTCAPMDDIEPKVKRKRKNETRTDQVITNSVALTNGEAAANGLESGGFVCGKSCLFLAATCPFVLIILIICLVISRRNLKRRRSGKQLSLLHKDVVQSNSGDCNLANGDLPLMQLENGFKFDPENSRWEFDRTKLVLDVILGEGEFGKVMKGYATDIAGIPGTTTVAVKMLKTGANSVEYMCLLSEFQLLQEVSHPNVIRLLGACTKGGDGEGPMIIIEYARYGSLRSYLRLSRKIECAGVDFVDGVEPVLAKDILSFAWQICKGMAYLTEIKLIHRDLALRNVLLADAKICKISDFGLTRDVYEDDAYLKRSRDRVPVKWMAPESLADHVYTTKSDVWAFGVLCWELITLGASPYPGIPPQNLYHLLKTGYRMECPENCSEDMYSIVRSCWTDDPNLRPSFKYLASQFEKLLGNNVKFLEYEAKAVSNPIYCSDADAKIIDGETSTNDELTKLEDLDKPESLEHLWRSPSITCEVQESGNNTRESTNTFSAEFLPPAGYDFPRPIMEMSAIEEKMRYENDLRFPLNIRKSSIATTPGSQYNCNANVPNYSVPVKHGRSYLDMSSANKNLLPENLDNDFEKHLSKTISFRFSSLLNLQEQKNDDASVYGLKTTPNTMDETHV